MSRRSFLPSRLAYSAPRKTPPARGVELGHVVEDLGDVARAALPVGGGRQEHAELVDLHEERRLAVQRREEPRAGGDLVAAEMIDEAGLEEELVDDLARVVLARAAVGDADDVEVRAEVGLGPVLPPHQRAEGAEAGAEREERLRPARGREHVADHLADDAARDDEVELRRLGGRASAPPRPWPAARPPDAPRRAARRRRAPARRPASSRARSRGGRSCRRRCARDGARPRSSRCRRARPCRTGPTRRRRDRGRPRPARPSARGRCGPSCRSRDRRSGSRRARRGPPPACRRARASGRRRLPPDAGRRQRLAAAARPARAPAPRRGRRAPPPRRSPAGRRCRCRRASPPASHRAGRCRGGWRARRTAGRGRAARAARAGCRGRARRRGRRAAASARGRCGAPACRPAAGGRAPRWRAPAPARTMSMSSATTGPQTTPMPASGHVDQMPSSCSVVARSACRVQSG